jgi:sphingomyelin phosphodiesterase acid-like 3
MRLLQTGNAVTATDPDAAIKPAWVAAKLVPSISPINGNNPTFTLADIDPKTATMKDYRVFSADNKTGIAAKWSEGYRYSVAYHSTGFTPEEVSRLMEKFGADKTGEVPESQAYESNFMPGGGLKSLAIRLVWPQYVCSMRQNTAAGFRDCMCPATP